MKSLAVAFRSSVFCALLLCLPASDVEAEKQIRQTLSAQVDAWNEGDIRGFMEGYVRSEELRFASGNSSFRGWQATFDRYQKSYDSREKMGRLKFSDLEIQVVSQEFAEVFGRFHLTRDAAVGDAEGLFTLLMQKSDGRWLVLHDHTSAAPPEAKSGPEKVESP
jgi:ketosteroid isomerase-like protein